MKQISQHSSGDWALLPMHFIHNHTREHGDWTLSHLQKSKWGTTWTKWLVTRLKENFSSCNSYKLCYLLGCIIAVPGLNESKQESKSVCVFPSRKANVFPAPSFFSLCTQWVPSNLPIWALQPQSPVTLLSSRLCCMLTLLSSRPGQGTGMAAVSPSPAPFVRLWPFNQPHQIMI